MIYNIFDGSLNLEELLFFFNQVVLNFALKSYFCLRESIVI
jgi:hypothetical protein